MIEKIKRFAKLKEELEEEYDVLSAGKDFLSESIIVHIDKLSTLLNIANGEAIHVLDHSEEYPYQLSYSKDGIIFFCLLDEEEYQEYKKAAATTATQRKMSP